MRLIASDLDGTLLNDKGVVSQANAKAIRTAMEKGIQFVVATGRSYDSASKLLQAVGISCPIISLNGSSTFDSNHQLLREIVMDPTVCQKVISVCQKNDIYIELFTNSGVYSTGKDQFMEVLTQMFKSVYVHSTDDEIRNIIELRLQNEKVQFVPTYEEILSNEKIKIYKILCFSVNEESLRSTNKELANEPGMIITSSGDMNLEFNHPNAQKGIALKEFANSLGIEMKDVMALGDNLNDKSMLEQAGRGVAMGNAAEEIKELCRYITKTNSEDGVAYAIEEMLKEYSL